MLSYVIIQAYTITAQQLWLIQMMIQNMMMVWGNTMDIADK